MKITKRDVPLEKMVNMARAADEIAIWTAFFPDKNFLTIDMKIPGLHLELFSEYFPMINAQGVIGDIKEQEEYTAINFLDKRETL